MVSVFTEVFLILNYHGDGSCPEPQARSLCPSPHSKLLQEMPVCWENPVKESNKWCVQPSVLGNSLCISTYAFLENGCIDSLIHSQLAAHRTKTLFDIKTVKNNENLVETQWVLF